MICQYLSIYPTFTTLTFRDNAIIALTR